MRRAPRVEERRDSPSPQTPRHISQLNRRINRDGWHRRRRTAHRLERGFADFLPLEMPGLSARAAVSFRSQGKPAVANAAGEGRARLAGERGDQTERRLEIRRGK